MPPKITKIESPVSETLSNNESNVLGIKEHPFRKSASANHESIAEPKEEEKKETPAIVMDEHNEEVEKKDDKHDVEKTTPTLVTEAVTNSTSPYRKEPLVVLVNEDDHIPTLDNAHNPSEIGMGSRPQPPKTMRTSNVSVTQSSFHNYQPPAREDVPTANAFTYEKSVQNAQTTVERQERSVAQNTMQNYQSTMEEYRANENTREETMPTYQPTTDEPVANENAQEDTLQSYQPTAEEYVPNEIAQEDTLPAHQPTMDKYVANENTQKDTLQSYQRKAEEYAPNENARENIPTYQHTVDRHVTNENAREDTLQNYQPAVDRHGANENTQDDTLQNYRPAVEEHAPNENARENKPTYQPTVDRHVTNENTREDTLQRYQPAAEEYLPDENARENAPTYQPTVDRYAANENTREDTLQRYQPAAEEYVPDENARENVPTYQPTVDRRVANENAREDTLPTYEPTVEKHVPNENARENTLQSYRPMMDEEDIPLEEYYVHPKQVGYELPKEGLLRSFNIEYPSMEEPPPRRDVSLLRGWGPQEESADQQAVPTNNHHSNEVEPQVQQPSPQQQESSPLKPESVAPKGGDFRVPTHVVRKSMSNDVPNSGNYPNQNDVSALTMEPVWRQPRKQLTPMPSSKARTLTKLHQPITEDDRQKIFRERFIRRQQQENNMQYVGNNIQPTVSAVTEATEYGKQDDLAGADQRIPNAEMGRNSEAVQVSSNRREGRQTIRNVQEQENDPSQIGTAQQFHDVILNASSQEIVSKGKTHYRKKSIPPVVWNADIGQFVSQDGQPLTEEQMAMLTNQLQYAARSGQQQQGLPPNHHQTREAEENEEMDDTFASPNGKMRTEAQDDDRLPFDTTHDLSPIANKASPAIVKEKQRPQQEEKRIAEVESVNGSMMSILSDTFTTKEGCYLVYGTDTGGKLSLHYSRTAIADAIGFWMPGAGKVIQGFKFSQNCGRVEIIKGIAGGDANKKKYYSGWCQFVKAARAFNGLVCKWPDRAGIEVDLYVFYNETSEVVKIQDGELFDTSKIDAVSCLRKGATVFDGVKKTPKRVFLDKGNSVGRCVDVVS